MSGPSEKASRAPGMTDGRPSGTGMENEQVVIETEGGGGGAPAKVGWRQKGMKDPCCCGQNKLTCCIFIIGCSIFAFLVVLAIIIVVVMLVILKDTTKAATDLSGNTGGTGFRKG